MTFIVRTDLTSCLSKAQNVIRILFNVFNFIMQNVRENVYFMTRESAKI